ncbi:hypothetical protein HDF16_001737 [Granulicella aggregans]|uniref:Uncharacterized protein n=1 Tax=Granulicella aggregans TaxID=474949 RepID=A0A7W7ZC30_9BACT|nr:hypothetical protein [Granulicella aggregans]
MGQPCIKEPSQLIPDPKLCLERISPGLPCGIPEPLPRTLPECLKIQHATMVDVRVCTLRTPGLRVGREVAFHVFMNKLLKI